MTIIYLPMNTISIDGFSIMFKEKRELVRAKLGKEYAEDNQIISISESQQDEIHIRRDIFTDSKSNKYFFFLGYDKEDLLSDMEVHRCEKIIVNEFAFGFDDDLDFIASKLASYSSVKKRGKGEYFFEDIRVSILDESQMGGEGDSLAYFYCAENVTHLLD
jgi:hypothetical protein